MSLSKEDYFKRGKEFTALGQNELAIKNYSDAILLDPAYVEAHLFKGDACMANKNYEEASICFETTTILKPQDAKAYHHLGNCYAQLKKFEEAIKAFEKIINLAPTLAAIAHCNIGNCFNALGKYEKSIENLLEAIKIDPNIGIIHYNIAHSYASLKNYNNAIEYFKTTIKMDTTLAAISGYHIGNCKLALGETEKALRYFKYVIINNPTNVEVHTKVRNDILHLKDYNSVIKFYEEVVQPNAIIKTFFMNLENDPQPKNKTLFINQVATAYFTKGNSFLQSQDYMGALGFYIKSIQMNSKNADCHHFMALCYNSLGEEEAANKCLNMAEKMRDNTQDPSYNEVVLPQLTKLSSNDTIKLSDDIIEATVLIPMDEYDTADGVEAIGEVPQLPAQISDV